MRKSPQKVDKIVGRNIRAYRLTKGLSQTELGDQLGISFQQIQKYEKGMNRVGSGRLFAISKILGVTVLSMFAGSKTAPSKNDGSSPFDLLKDPLSLRLVRTFSKISEPQIRRSLVKLVETMSAARKT
jgi:transcriptional regulator with XRE-family HTH domain